MNMDSSSSKQAVDESNESDMDLLNFGLDELKITDPSEGSQSNISTINNSFGGGSTYKLQRQIPQEMMNVRILTRNSISSTLQRSAPVGFATANQFSSNETWPEYAFRQVAMMKERYINEVISMHKRAVFLCTQAASMEITKKYDNAKEFLEKIITFLNIPRVEMIPQNNERVYIYMNFIVNFMTLFRNKNSDSSQNFNEVINQQLFPQATSSQSQVVVNLEGNQQPAHQITDMQHDGEHH